MSWSNPHFIGLEFARGKCVIYLMRPHCWTWRNLKPYMLRSEQLKAISIGPLTVDWSKIARRNTK